jgi:hypothetical protein
LTEAKERWQRILDNNELLKPEDKMEDYINDGKQLL